MQLREHALTSESLSKHVNTLYLKEGVISFYKTTVTYEIAFTFYKGRKKKKWIIPFFFKHPLV